MSLGYIRNQTEQIWGRQVSKQCFSSVPASRFPPWPPTLSSLDDRLKSVSWNKPSVSWNKPNCFSVSAVTQHPRSQLDHPLVWSVQISHSHCERCHFKPSSQMILTFHMDWRYLIRKLEFQNNSISKVLWALEWKTKRKFHISFHAIGFWKMQVH